MSTVRSLELFFVDGRPDGMLTAEVFNWTGHVLRIPKIRLPEGLRRTEAKQTGVYILLGQDEEGYLAYIGEAENMADRLRQHASQKDWWDEAVLVTTAGDALHKAHVKYLESRLVEIAKDAGTMRLENGNIPPKASLNEAATANMESFLETLHMVFPAIRVDMFQSKKRAATKLSADASFQDEQIVKFELRAQRKGLVATAQIVNGEFTVQAGSQIVSEWVGNRRFQLNYQKRHQFLMNSDVIEKKDDLSSFRTAYAFSSPSTAASILLGRSANGRTEWKLEDGRTYADWEDAQLEEGSEQPSFIGNIVD